MFEIKKLFNEDEIKEKSDGNFQLECPDCGLQGSRTEGFILFTDSNTAYCHSSHKHFSLLEAYALKKGIIKCLEGRETGETEGILKGALFKETLDALREEYSTDVYNEIVSSIGLKQSIELPGNGILISNFANELAERLKNENIFFYRSDIRQIVEIGKIRHANGDIFYNGFVNVDSSRFVTIIERYFKPWTTIYTKFGKMEIDRSMQSNVANMVLVSDNFRDKMPVINRIFNVQIPILYENKLTFPCIGYDKRFSSWLPYNSPKISNPEMSLDEAKKIIYFIMKEFCFQSKQDYINAISGLLTPYIRGLFTAFNIRTPIFIYEANRERAGKDYLAGINGVLYEGYALEEPPLSNGDRNSNSEELRKKVVSALITGRKRMHFSNNKGHLNNAVFESISTAEKYSDRMLGKNEILTFDNELDFSLSGNIGMTLTPDLSNRSRFIRLFLDIEDANARKFDNPNLHLWVKENRNLILSALYSLVKNWIEKGMIKGTLPFASFPQWANICGGIMEAAKYGNPCKQDENTTGVSIDNDTNDMKNLFELCYEKKPDIWMKKQEIIDMIKESDEGLFSYIDWSNRSEQTKFGIRFNKYIGRILSNIVLIVENKNERPARWNLKFTKNIENVDKKEIFEDLVEKNGNLGILGNVYASPISVVYNTNIAIGHKLPSLPRLPKIIPETIKLTKIKSDREVQFWEADECQDIKPNHTKEEVFNWIKENPEYNYKQIYDKFGVGSLKFRNQLKKEGLI